MKTLILTIIITTLATTTLAQSVPSTVPTTPTTSRYGVHQDIIGEELSQYIENNQTPGKQKGIAFRACEAPVGGPSTWVCTQRDGSYGNNGRLVIEYHFVGGRPCVLEHIDGLLDHSQYRITREAFINKYGQPTDTEMVRYQNGYGATFQGEVVKWEQAGAEVVLTEHEDKDYSSFTIRDTAKDAATYDAAQDKANKRF